MSNAAKNAVVPQGYYSVAKENLAPTTLATCNERNCLNVF